MSFKQCKSGLDYRHRDILALADGEFCQISSSGEFAPLKTEIRAGTKGINQRADGMSMSLLHLDGDDTTMMVSLGITHKNDLVSKAIRKADKAYGGFNLNCFFSKSRTTVSIDELNEMTRNFIHFEL